MQKIIFSNIYHFIKKKVNVILKSEITNVLSCNVFISYKMHFFYFNILLFSHVIKDFSAYDSKLKNNINGEI